ncbi:MAG TPA: biotin-dependent carboxyltransferase, partial [Sneathiellales bacterium]|nr:biotin-dependent carboxyltransferase [Sneathiellales bacterium]
FMGPALEFTVDAIVAVTGAEMTPKVDDQLRETWTSFAVKAGQILSFEILKSGARAYIAIAGGIDVPMALGSRSTYSLGGLGGHEGRALVVDDELSLGQAGLGAKSGIHIAPKLRRSPGNPAELRMLPGLYWHRVTDVSGRNFFDDTWQVAPEADRIGYRFRGGRKLEFVDREQPFGAGSDPSNIVDGCYPYGSVQVPGGTEPIVLHRDAVSGGGYFMLGTVISADMDLIGQLQPHTATRFIEVTLEGAMKARRGRQNLLDELRASLD